MSPVSNAKPQRSQRPTAFGTEGWEFTEARRKILEGLTQIAIAAKWKASLFLTGLTGWGYHLILSILSKTKT